MYNVVNNKNDKNSLIINIIIFLIVIFILLRNLFFIVDDTQFAIIVDRSNKIVRIVEKAGLNWRNPFTTSVLFFEKRIINLDLKNQILKIENDKNVKFDAFLRFKIVNLESFYNNVINNDNFLKILENNINRLIINNNFDNLLVQNYNLDLGSFGIQIVDFNIKKFSFDEKQKNALKSTIKANLEKNLNKNIVIKEEIIENLNEDLINQVNSIINDAKITGERLKTNADVNYFKTINNIINNDAQFYDIYQKSRIYKDMKLDNTKYIINMKGI